MRMSLPVPEWRSSFPSATFACSASPRPRMTSCVHRRFLDAASPQPGARSAICATALDRVRHGSDQPGGPAGRRDGPEDHHRASRRAPKSTERCGTGPSSGTHAGGTRCPWLRRASVRRARSRASSPIEVRRRTGAGHSRTPTACPRSPCRATEGRPFPADDPDPALGRPPAGDVVKGVVTSQLRTLVDCMRNLPWRRGARHRRQRAARRRHHQGRAHRARGEHAGPRPHTDHGGRRVRHGAGRPTSSSRVLSASPSWCPASSRPAARGPGRRRPSPCIPISPTSSTR